MNSTLIAVFAFAGIFGAVLIGMRLRTLLPDTHLSQETKDTIRLGMGLVATMTALLLGLLVASAKGSYDIQRGEVIQMAARIGFLDRVLTVYGPEANDNHELLRRAVDAVEHEMWVDRGQPNQNAASLANLAVYNSIQKLAPQNDEQRSLKGQAMDTCVEIGKTRWLLFAQSDSSIATPVLTLVVVWLAIIFVSFGLFAPVNKTVVITMIIVALSVSSALFLILELDQPFNGVIQISSEPLRSALNHSAT
jgi:hypothetical protein